MTIASGESPHRGCLGCEREQLLRAAITASWSPDMRQSRRLFHGRGQCFPGLEALIVDWHPPVALVVLYSAEMEDLVGVVCEDLSARLGEALAGIRVQRRYLPGTPSEVIHGRVPEPVFAREAALRFRLRLDGAQNVGFFPDMELGRRLVRQLSAGRQVLNLFAYTCAFSVSAVAGGAAGVVNVDMNRGALRLGRDNHLENGLDLRRATFLAHDLFKSFGKLERLGPFGLVIIDPPSEQGRSFSARRDWPKLVRRLPNLAPNGADVIACLNSPLLGAEFLEEIFAAECPPSMLLEVLGAPDTFPERYPERGLKILHYRL